MGFSPGVQSLSAAGKPLGCILVGHCPPRSPEEGSAALLPPPTRGFALGPCLTLKYLQWLELKPK